MTTTPTKASLPSRSAIFATLLGNWFEFFDFGVYAIFAVTIGQQFFPVASTSGQLLLSVGTFGVGFVMRPLGGVVIGAYADRKGRKAALTLTIALMAIGTALLGLTPPYSAIGPLAPALVVVARLLQGFSAGGEVGAATTYLLELAPAGRRGLYGSGQIASQGLAILSASAMGYGLARALSPEAMASWGFRVPFLFGVLIGPVGLYVRRHLHETSASTASAARSSLTLLRELVREDLRLVLVGVMTICGGTVATYVLGKYMTTFAVHTLGMPMHIGMLASVIAGAVTFLFAIVGGWLSDIVGRRVVMIAPRALLCLATVPAFWWITTERTPSALLVAIAALVMLQAASGAVSIIALPECFPRERRTSGLSITYAVGVTIFGGSAQVVVTWLADVTGDPMSVAWYVAGTNVVSVLALFALRPPSVRAELA